MNFSGSTKDPSVWKRLNQRGGSLFLLIVLFDFVGFNHLFAFTKLGVSLAVVDDRTLGEIRLIQFVQDHLDPGDLFRVPRRRMVLTQSPIGVRARDYRLRSTPCDTLSILLSGMYAPWKQNVRTGRKAGSNTRWGQRAR